MQEQFQFIPKRTPIQMFALLAVLIIISKLFITCKNTSTGVDRGKVFVMTTDLVNDSSLIHLYDSLHSKYGVWPELKKANLVSGIREIKIYRYNTRLTMFVHMSEDADLSKMDSLYINADEKIKAWGKLMTGFQRALPGRDTSEKWVEMKLIHHYKDGEYWK